MDGGVVVTTELKDYYEILGVRPEAGREEIKRAYRRMARAHHPDVAGNQFDAEERFKRINEANEVLSDPAKRRDYDQKYATRVRRDTFDRTEKTATDRPRYSYPAEDAGYQDFGFRFRRETRGDFSGHSFRSAGNRRQSREERGRTHAEHPGSHSPDVEVDILVSLEEVAFGSTRPISFHHTVACGSCRDGRSSDGRSCCECEGSGRIIVKRNYRVKIPPGVYEGQRLKLSTKEENFETTGVAGDLFLRVRLSGHSSFTIEEGALWHELVLAPWEAMTGTTVTLSTPAGRVSVKIPRGTRHGQKLRVRHYGLPAQGGKRGDLYIRVSIQIPEKTSPDERAIWERFSGQFHL